ncbi:MAG TPA: EamA family transporter [Thermoanaerobaculia bacterium]|nr:EamA family transporter [Thermoanaerobaculia bacterium]
MPPTALALLLVAAILHAGWNLLVKQARERFVFTWWAMVVGSLAFLPVLLASRPLPARVAPYAFGSALLEAAYVATLAAAYGRGDFSLVYPVARGAAPALLAAGSVVFLGERLRPAGVAGLAILVLGLMVVGGSGRWRRRAGEGVGTGGVGLALLVAVLIASYSVVDGAAVRIARPGPYTVLVVALTALVLTPIVVRRYGWRALGEEWRAAWPRITLVGILSMLAYILVLGAYSIARVAYAGAVREVSVVFGALAGWRFLGEGFGLARTAGAILVFAGILVLALSGS